MNNEPKEAQVFHTYTKYNKLKIAGIALLIAIISITAMYFFVKSLFKYTVTYELNGGSVYKQELKETQYNFLSKVFEPEKVKKEGYYIDYWSKDSNLNSKFQFGTRIWNSFTLYVKWEEGFAVRLNFAEGEENQDLPINDLKGYYEQYVEPGSSYDLPLIYNTKVGSDHYGEQLLWYDNPECTGEPFDTKTFVVNQNIDIYGRWFDTDEKKFSISEDGTLNRYLGECNKIILPSTVKKIKNIEYGKFITGQSGENLNDQDGTYQSVWQNVLTDDTGVNSLKIIYLNSELIEIGDCAFRDCESLEQVIFCGDNVERIGEGAFENCSKLIQFQFPTKVTEIESNTFNGAFDRTKNVELDLKNVENISDSAFINANMRSITLNKVEFIGSKAFAGCNNLHNFEIFSTNVILSNVEGSAEPNNSNGIFFGTYRNYGGAQNLKIFVPSSLITEYLKLTYWLMYSDVIFGN